MCDVMKHYESIAKEEGIQEGAIEKAKDMALSLASMGNDENKIAVAAKVSVETVREWIKGQGS